MKTGNVALTFKQMLEEYYKVIEAAGLVGWSGGVIDGPLLICDRSIKIGNAFEALKPLKETDSKVSGSGMGPAAVLWSLHRY